MANTRPRVVVLGGAGAMGRIIARDLKEFFETSEIIIADFDLAKAKPLARALGSRVSAAFADVTQPKSLAQVLRDAFVVINSAPYQWNLEVMQAALLARCHYIDLGGLFHMTRRQLKLARRFTQIGRLGLLGMGAAPGITNLLAADAVETLDSVSSIHLRVGSADRSRYRYLPALPVSYSLKTILEEFSMPPAVFTRGRFRMLTPMSGEETHRFPLPVGVSRPFHTLHSEVATLPLSFAHKGVREVSFKIAFDDAFTDRVRFLRDMGFAAHEPVVVRGHPVPPIEVVNAVAMRQRAPERVGPLRQHEVIRAIVQGKRRGKAVALTYDCHCPGRPQWDIGTDIDTGSPPAIAAEMLWAGEIPAIGVLPPELTVPTRPFFSRLRRRGMWVTRRTGSRFFLP